MMGNFISLVSVENIKLWKRLSTKLMILIMAVAIVGIWGLVKMAADLNQQFIDSKQASQSEKLDWKERLKKDNESIQAIIDSAEKSDRFRDKSTLDQNKRQIAENKYRIEHNLKPIENRNYDIWFDLSTMGIWQIVALFVIIATTALVAGEFSESTMKTMIPRPYARWQILTAKFIAVLIYTVVMTVIGYLVSLGAAAIFFGTSQFKDPVLLWLGGNIVEVSSVAAAFILTGLEFLSVLVYVIFTFALCAVARSRALATGLAIFLMFGGSLTQLIAQNFDWGKYIFFADTNFSSFTTFGSISYGLTLPFALVICAIYCIVFMFAGYFAFAKRDIA